MAVLVGRRTTEKMFALNIEVPALPQSEALELYEVFSLSDDGSRLNYHLTATDPTTFTEPVELDKAWMWRPGEVVKPYDCTPSA